MKKKSVSESAPGRRSVDEGGFFNLRASIGLFVFLAGVSFALFATANPLQLASGASVNGSPQTKASVVLRSKTAIPSSGNWTFTGSLNTARDVHTSTLLPNGMVLVAGGTDIGSVSTPSAELYDPASGNWTVTG